MEEIFDAIGCDVFLEGPVRVAVVSLSTLPIIETSGPFLHPPPSSFPPPSPSLFPLCVTTQTLEAGAGGDDFEGSAAVRLEDGGGRSSKCC